MDDTMTAEKGTLESLLARADAWSDAARARLRKSGPAGPLMIMPYKGYGTPGALSVAGRVLRDPGFADVQHSDSRWRNLVELYKRLESDEVPGARVRCWFQGTEHDVTADEEGYFRCEFEPAHPVQAGVWHEVALELLSPSGGSAIARAPVLVPSHRARFGIISDIDDTVLQSNVAKKLRMLLLVALSNARTRKPFPGVAAFYSALQRGLGNEGNPVFYVSSSPWNLYTPLMEFLDVQDIPSGPLLLKDFGDHTLFSHADHRSHKLSSIERILIVYPALPFVLIGDSGEQDPEIYAEVVKRFPSRISVIYIRNVTHSAERMAAIASLIDQVRAHKTQLVLAPDSEFAAAHAAAEGLISPDAWLEVGNGKLQDQAAPAAEQLAKTAAPFTAE
jgi:phosphatidate phosphatase APP1